MFLLLGAALVWAPSAQAQTSCGALITLGPDIGQTPPGDVLTPGAPNNVVTITVAILQTCLTGGVPQTANVTGTTRVDVACATANNLTDASGTGCSPAEQLNTLHVTGCVGEAGVNCAAANDGNGNPTIAEITYTDPCPDPPGGSTCKELAFGTLVPIATITATTQPGQQVISPASGEFAVTASTEGSSVFTADAAASAQGSAPEFYPAPTPTFTVDKSCAAVFNPVTQQVDVSFTATVTNQDTFEAINYDCVDVPAVALTNNPGQAPVAPPGTAVVTGTYSQAGLDASDTITCTAVGAVTGFSAGTQSATASCVATTSPSIDVPKTCTMVFNQATQQFDVSFTATLTNTGNETIDNITCQDTPNVSLSGVPMSLGPGLSAVITGTYSTGSNPSSDTITCSGTGATSTTPVTSTQSATCGTTVTPTASLSKSCSVALNAQGTGVVVSYTATLINTGPENLDVTACVDVPPASVNGVPVNNVAPGAAVTITGSYAQASPSAADTLTCSATGTVSGATITPSANTTCATAVAPAATLVKTCTAASGAGTVDVSFAATLTNTGLETINNISCSDDPVAALTNVPSSLPPGGSATITGSYSQASPLATDTLTCSGTGAISGSGISVAAPATCEAPQAGICRTPGFWGTHPNITQLVLEQAMAKVGGSLEICGELIDTTTVPDQGSALEAICETPATNKKLPLHVARDLMSAALNCAVTSSGPAMTACDGVAIDALFEACNTACAAVVGTGNKVTVNLGGNDIDCNDAIDCFNNGQGFDPVTGQCGGRPGLCDENNVVGSCSISGELCTDNQPCPPGAGKCKESSASPGACNAARRNSCTIFSPIGC